VKGRKSRNVFSQISKCQGVWKLRSLNWGGAMRVRRIWGGKGGLRVGKRLLRSDIPKVVG